MTALDSNFSRWVYALKPASWLKLLVPTLLGQALGVASNGDFNPLMLLIGLVITFLLLIFIVLLNDWGDQKVDRIKRQTFPDDCSPKTIIDEILPARSLLCVGVTSGALALLLAVSVEHLLGRPFLGVATCGCLFIFVAYTLPPIALNYRGGGELLEMIGVGAALPLLQAYVQAGAWPLHTSVVLWAFVAMSLASAIASGLSDEQSDRAGGKRTWVTMVGNRVARRSIEALVATGAVLWVGTAIYRPAILRWWVVLPAIAALIWNLLAMRSASETALTNAFKAQGRYKRYVHRAIWHSGIVLSAMMIIEAGIR